MKLKEITDYAEELKWFQDMLKANPNHYVGYLDETKSTRKLDKNEHRRTVYNGDFWTMLSSTIMIVAMKEKRQFDEYYTGKLQSYYWRAPGWPPGFGSKKVDHMAIIREMVGPRRV